MTSSTKRILIGLMVVGVITGVRPGPARSAPLQRTYQIKAAFLYNFAKFIEWPPEAFATDQSPFRLCVLGNDPFGAALHILQDKRVRGRQMALHYLNPGGALTTCHLLFISVSEHARLSLILSAIASAPVLTVSEIDHFARSGGAVHLFTDVNKIRFAINLDATRRASLTVSSKLLHLAKSVTATQ